MQHSTLDIIALTFIGLTLGCSVWVFIIHPLGMIGSMPRPQFIVQQMRMARLWSRAMVPMTVALSAAMIAGRAAHSEHMPALVSLGAALLQWWVVLPRAIKAGGDSLRQDDAHDLDAGSFLADGGGKSTRLWHRVVLLLLVVYLSGLVLSGRIILSARSAAAL